jgi:mRNA interferase HigB
MKMRVIARKMLIEFWRRHKNAEQPLRAWHAEAEKAYWKGPQDIKERYRSASFLSDSRVVFNVKGNRYRLIVTIRYDYGMVYIRFIGTHAEYDRIDATSV